MMWTVAMIILGAYSGLVIAAKNPSVAVAMARWHDKVTAWVYMWIPKLYQLIKDKWF